MAAIRKQAKEVELRYPIAIEIGDEETAFGVVVPDLPGCFSAGGSLDEAIEMAHEAALLWIETTLDAGKALPPPSRLDVVRANPDYAGWVMGVIDIDPADLDNTSERVNIILPRRILRRLDAQAKAQGESRSAYIAQLAMAAL